jgi:hypothetical protein
MSSDPRHRTNPVPKADHPAAGTRTNIDRYQPPRIDSAMGVATMRACPRFSATTAPARGALI